MQYIDFKSLLYSDTLVPDVFINEYLPALKSEYVKIYLYCLFLVGKNKNPSVGDLARILDIPHETVKAGLQFMNNINILSWAEDGVVLKDLKEIEINRFYRPKSTSTAEEAYERNKLNVRRHQVTKAINDTFYSGVMATSWYLDIDHWFDLYGFEEDVMMLLFRHCRDNGVLTKSYVAKVAENMHASGVINSYDFDRYIHEYELTKSACGKIRKKLKLRRNLDEYQEELVNKWTNAFGFSFDIIELAMKKTVDKPDVSFKYFDAVITNWHKAGLDTVEKIQAAQKRHRDAAAPEAGAGAEGRPAGAGMPERRYNKGGFRQREYSDEELEKFVTNEFGIKRTGVRDGAPPDGEYKSSVLSDGDSRNDGSPDVGADGASRSTHQDGGSQSVALLDDGSPDAGADGASRSTHQDGGSQSVALLDDGSPDAGPDVSPNGGVIAND